MKQLKQNIKTCGQTHQGRDLQNDSFRDTTDVLNLKRETTQRFYQKEEKKTQNIYCANAKVSRSTRRKALSKKLHHRSAIKAMKLVE